MSQQTFSPLASKSKNKFNDTLRLTITKHARKKKKILKSVKAIQPHLSGFFQV